MNWLKMAAGSGISDFRFQISEGGAFAAQGGGAGGGAGSATATSSLASAQGGAGFATATSSLASAQGGGAGNGVAGGGADGAANGGGAGAGLAADGAVAGNTRSSGAGAAEPTSAFATKGAEGAGGGEGNAANGAGNTADGAAGGEPREAEGAAVSAFAAKNAAGGAAADKTQAVDDGLTMTREALGGMSDADWVSATLEGVEGAHVDDPILTGIAQTCREVGVSPKQMNRIQSKFTEVLNERIGKLQAEKDAAEREAAQNAAKESLAAFDDSEWADIRAAGREYIPEGSELSKLMQGSLGSNKEMLTILKTLGESLRGDAPSSTGARGSGLSLEERLFRKTVPAGLR